MQDNTMKKLYMISRLIMTITIFILLNIWFICDNDPNLILSIILSSIVFCVSFPSSVISRKLINIGNKLPTKLIKILYYIIILPIILILFSILVVGLTMYGAHPSSGDFSNVLGTGLKFMFLSVVELICLIVPYIQTLIVLLLIHLFKIK